MKHFSRVFRNQAFKIRLVLIFRRETEVFLYMLVPDFQELMVALAHSDIDRRWQQTMAPLLEKVPSLKQDETFAIMEEVFYMPGVNTLNSGRR
jgi:L-rhamnose mutarotase